MFAKIRLFWVRSVSTDVVSRKVSVSKDGGEPSVSELSPDVTEIEITANANSTVSFKTEVTDSEGLTTVSSIASVTLGDLVPPQPDTDLGFEILSVNENDPAPPE